MRRSAESLSYTDRSFSVLVMKPERLRQLIMQHAATTGMSDEERAVRLLIADRINAIGTDDLDELVYRLADDGQIDGETLNAYLVWADEIADEDIEP